MTSSNSAPTPAALAAIGLSSVAPKDPQMSLADFLMEVPPGKASKVGSQTRLVQKNYGERYEGRPPQIKLHCPTCDGIRIFESDTEILAYPDKVTNSYWVYRCRNCAVSSKTYAIRVTARVEHELEVFKYGETPRFGPPTPASVSKMLGDERDYYYRGQSAEAQGLGIAAFAYYRRVVDHRRVAIIDSILKVAEQNGESQELLGELKAARAETRFTEAVNKIKHAIPQSLMIAGENPLLLLHSALSDGLHDRSDSECLELAQHVRIVLSELIERAALALKEDKDLAAAVAALRRMPGAKGVSKGSQ